MRGSDQPGVPGVLPDERALEVLRIVVREHVRTGEPVSSRQVARFHAEQLSPATIRTIMADLTDGGFLEQPHTSAGRVPSDKGYRSFVDEVLTAREDVPEAEARRIEEILVSSRQVEDLLGRAGRLLGQLTNQVAMVLAPDIAQVTLEHVEFIRIAPLRVVAIFVGRAGVVVHRVVELDEDLTQDELDRVGASLRGQVAGMTLPEARLRLIASLRADRDGADRLGREAARAVLRVIEEPFAETVTGGELIVDGTSRLLDLPEFGDLARLRDMMRAIEEKSRLLRLLDRCLTAPGVQVIIGSETADPGMAPMAVVASPYGAPGAAQGLVGVLGPRRMEYARAVALVDHFARTISTLLSPGRPRSEEP